MPEDQAARLRSWLSVASHLQGHVFILTSGSTASSEADYKWVALSKAAILSSAEASNSRLQCDGNDVWLHCLPNFHVGGMGIWARALLSGARVVPLESWDARKFAEQSAGATLSSLVPAQVHDLVQLGLTGPRSMRAILVGGAALADSLFLRARELGWPVLTTYGLSEAASQVATANLGSLDRIAIPKLEVMPHLRMRSTPENLQLQIRGGSVLTAYVALDSTGEPHIWDPKDQEGWFMSEDLGELRGDTLILLGRAQERIKIGGEISNLGLLRRILDEEASILGLSPQIALFAMPDDRLGHTIALAYEQDVNECLHEQVVDRFNLRVLPFERVRSSHAIDRIPRTDLGKVKWSELAALLFKSPEAL